MGLASLSRPSMLPGAVLVVVSRFAVQSGRVARSPGTLRNDVSHPDSRAVPVGDPKRLDLRRACLDDHARRLHAGPGEQRGLLSRRLERPPRRVSGRGTTNGSGGTQSTGTPPACRNPRRTGSSGIAWSTSPSLDLSRSCVPVCSGWGDFGAWPRQEPCTLPSCAGRRPSGRFRSGSPWCWALAAERFGAGPRSPHPFSSLA